MTRGGRNLIDRVEQKTKILMKGGMKTKYERSTIKGLPFSIDAKGGEKSSMMKGGA